MNETAYELDTEAIRKRFAEAVVAFYKFKGAMDIYIPFGDKYRALATRGWIPNDGSGFCEADWLIRPGDMAEFSDDGKYWLKYIYRGFSGGVAYPFLCDENACKFIRPLPQTSPEKVKVMEQIEKMEKELAELRARAEELR